jgi:hypothetical protein
MVNQEDMKMTTMQIKKETSQSLTFEFASHAQKYFTAIDMGHCELDGKTIRFETTQDKRNSKDFAKNAWIQLYKASKK